MLLCLALDRRRGPAAAAGDADLPVGTAYVVFTGIGGLGALILGVAITGDPLTLTRVARRPAGDRRRGDPARRGAADTAGMPPAHPKRRRGTLNHARGGAVVRDARGKRRTVPEARVGSPDVRLAALARALVVLTAVAALAAPGAQAKTRTGPRRRRVLHAARPLPGGAHGDADLGAQADRARRCSRARRQQARAVPLDRRSTARRSRSPATSRSRRARRPRAAGR